MSKRKKRFQPVPSPFGVGNDEQATQDAFVEFVGGTRRADQLSRIAQNSYPHGTEMDRLMGHGLTREQVFRCKAKQEGFTDEEVDAFLML